MLFSYIFLPFDRSGAYILASFLVIIENLHRIELSRQPLSTFALVFSYKRDGWIGLTSKIRAYVLLSNLGFCKKNM